MSRRAHAVRRAVPILLTMLLAVAAAVAVVRALPDGTPTSAAAQSHSQQQSAGPSTPPRSTSPTSDTPAAAAVVVPALPGPSAAEAPDAPTAPPDAVHSADPQTTDQQSAAEPTGPGHENYVTSGSLAGSMVTTSASAAGRPAASASAKPVSTAPKPPATSAKPSATATKPAPTTAKPPTSTAKPPATTPKPAAPNFGIPVTLGNATQLITVTAKTRTATVGTLRAWEKTTSGTWRTVYGPVTANLGSAGIGPASESYSRTPLGTFTLTEAFGRLANPGTALPYHVTGPNDWWVSDVRAASYNTMQTCARASCPFNTRLAEHLQSITPYYDYAVVMDVNRSPVVKGGGSAFFLHVTVGTPTAGCVAIDRATLVKIMRWLKPAARPRIATGIG